METLEIALIIITTILCLAHVVDQIFSQGIDGVLIGFLSFVVGVIGIINAPKIPTAYVTVMAIFDACVISVVASYALQSIQEKQSMRNSAILMSGVGLIFLVIAITLIGKPFTHVTALLSVVSFVSGYSSYRYYKES